MMACYRAALMLMFDDGNSGLIALWCQYMPLIIVGHYAGDLAGVASQALLAIGHNKTIHGVLSVLVTKTLFFIRALLLTDEGGVGNVHLPRKAQLSIQNLWQINLFHNQ
ncbi:Uncharacterised protein [Salmonella bongori]|nr:Uncharacterised protein [Salmonella bongori]